MTKVKNPNISHAYTNSLYGYVISKFLPTITFKWRDSIDLQKQQ